MASLKYKIADLLAALCREALVEETEDNPAVSFFIRAPEGKSISQEATSISLNKKDTQLLHQVTDNLRRDRELRLALSKKEVGMRWLNAYSEALML